MSLFKGEKPQLGTTVIQSTYATDSPLQVNAANGSSVMTISNSGTVAVPADGLTSGSKIIPQTWTIHAIPLIVTPATSGNSYIVPRACKVVSIKEAHSANATGVTLNLRKITDTSAPSAAAGATVKELLSSALVCDSALNTVVTGTLSATAADYTFAAGDRLCWNASGAMTSYAGTVIVEFQAV